ncbi:MAG: transposase, partial [Sphingomonadales bacterium]|nr:transposase [Sphingomonadales bacterium]
RKFSSEEKIRIVISGLRGEESINTICRQEGIAPALYYRWSKDFIEAGKRRLNGDTLREANSDEVNQIKNENVELKNRQSGGYPISPSTQFLALPPKSRRSNLKRKVLAPVEIKSFGTPRPSNRQRLGCGLRNLN